MRQTTERDYRRRILKVMDHLRAHLDDAPSFERLAEIACLSPFHFHRIYRGMTGETMAEVPIDQVRYDACFGLSAGPDPVLPDDELHWLDIAGGRYAVYRHVGPYTLIGESFDRLYGQWLPKSGVTLRSAPRLEIYLNDARSTPPDRLVTELALPIEA